MAVPAAPANLAARPGPEPQSLCINADAVTADPVVTTYTAYVDTVTGAAITQFSYKEVSTRPYFTLLGLPHAERYFVNMTATSSEAESLDGTEVEVVMSF